jgi:hypothetical protein
VVVGGYSASCSLEKRVFVFHKDVAHIRPERHYNESKEQRISIRLGMLADKRKMPHISISTVVASNWSTSSELCYTGGGKPLME